MSKKYDVVLPLVAITTRLNTPASPLRVFELDFEETCGLSVVREATVNAWFPVYL